MKKFWIRLATFTIIFIICFLGYDFLSSKTVARQSIAFQTGSESYIGAGTEDIVHYIEQIKNQNNSTKLIVGDSVCNQLFNGLYALNEDFTIAGSNGAITMAGQYIMIKSYLDNHPKATDVFLIMLPDSLQRTFDTKLGYQYTVLPFIETDTLKYLDHNTIEAMSSTYGNIFMNSSIANLISKSGLNRKLYLNYISEQSGYIQNHPYEIAEQYLDKMVLLCQEKNVNFYLYPSIVSDKNITVDYKKDISDSSSISKINPAYFESIYYFPSELSGDGTHLKVEYADRESLNQIIREAYANTELLNYLALE